MTKLSSSKILSLSVILLSLLLLAKITALVLWWYLPSEGVDLNIKKSYTSRYQRIDFKNMLLGTAKQNRPQNVQKNVSSTYNINNMVLNGLYGNEKEGFAIVAKKSNLRKTAIVGIGENFEGYTLKDIKIDRVIFTRGGKDYVLKLQQKSKLKNTSSYIQRSALSNDGSEYSVSKSDINYYSKNPSQIWRDIAISEVRRGGRITGFRVNRIRPNSKMAQIGLKVGDLIIKANNIRLKSYRDAIRLYNDIDNIDTIDLVVIRNNKEKEIIYEIR